MCCVEQPLDNQEARHGRRRVTRTFRAIEDLSPNFLAKFYMSAIPPGYSHRNKFEASCRWNFREVEQRKETGQLCCNRVMGAVSIKKRLESTKCKEEADVRFH